MSAPAGQWDFGMRRHGGRRPCTRRRRDGAGHYVTAQRRPVASDLLLPVTALRTGPTVSLSAALRLWAFSTSRKFSAQSHFRRPFVTAGALPPNLFIARRCDLIGSQIPVFGR